MLLALLGHLVRLSARTLGQTIFYWSYFFVRAFYRIPFLNLSIKPAPEEHEKYLFEE
jgi:hypothetical protein